MSERIPLPIPFGWFRISDSDELANGEVRAERYVGRDLVLWRGAEALAPVPADSYAGPVEFGDGGIFRESFGNRRQGSLANPLGKGLRLGIGFRGQGRGNALQAKHDSGNDGTCPDGDTSFMRPGYSHFRPVGSVFAVPFSVNGWGARK